jgi:hypothetical protein
MFNKHFYALIACCTFAAALLFAAFTPPNNLQNKVKTQLKTNDMPVDCSCTFSSGSCSECTCSGGFATGCAAVMEFTGGQSKPFSVSMSDNQLRQALKYQRLLLSLDSPEAIEAAAQVSQLIEAVQDGKTDLYQQVAEAYNQTNKQLPKAEKELIDTWIGNKQVALEKTLHQKLDKN